MTGILLIISMCVLFLFGAYIAIAMGLSSLIVMWSLHIPLVTLPQKMISGIDSFPLVAIPFFILAGELMNTGGITQRLVDFSRSLVGHIRGGFAHVNIVTNMILAGISGSAVADATGSGKILIPAMIKAGYSKRMAAAVTAAASTIGPIIPPSIGMVIYAGIADVSVGRMFLGGVIPGILMGLYLLIVAYIISRRRGYGIMDKVTWRERGQAFVKAFFPLMTPVLMLGGIVFGFFTPTEAAVVTCAYALVLGLVNKELKLKDLPHIIKNTVVSSSVILLIVSASTVGGWLLGAERIPQAILQSLVSLTDNPAIVLIFINIFFLILGCFVDPVPLIIVITPMLMPVIQAFHIDPIHFGLIMMLNFMIGLITPPVGMVMYIASNIAKIRMDEFVKEIIPYFVALLLVLILVTFVPEIVLWLPNYMMGSSSP